LNEDAQSALEQGAEENIWTQEKINKYRLDKFTYKCTLHQILDLSEKSAGMR
jgi:hypothetical protein